MQFFPSSVDSNINRIVPVSVIAVIVISYFLFFILQNITETTIKNTILEQQKQRQIESTQAITQHIGSDLDSIMARLKGLANSIYFQNDQISTKNAKDFVRENFDEIGHVIDRLTVVNGNNTIVMNIVSEGKEDFTGANFSKIEFVRETQELKKPIFSGGYLVPDGNYMIGLAYPIINKIDDKYLGMIVAEISTEKFFAHYGNIHDIKSQFLVVFDKNAVMLANGASKDLVGKDFFGEYTQKFIKYNPVLNNLTKFLLEGNFAYGIYDYGRGERITVQQSIFVNGNPQYFIQNVQPTQQIYSQIDNILFSQRIQTFLILATFTFVSIIIMVFYIKWNSILQKVVKRRTEELQESNQKLKESNVRLEEVNEQLKIHDKLQKEFINIAAHELRTPTQAIVGYLELFKLGETRTEIIDAIKRNADRLQTLTNNILDITRIEGGKLKLNILQINLADTINNIVKDVKYQLPNIDFNIIWDNRYFEHTVIDKITINADKARITQVITNLINNSIKFTHPKGRITLIISMINKIEENKFKHYMSNEKEIVISVRDNGTGIDQKVFPKLFSKFATTSFTGTGLGLYISKSIIETHGGRIWAENNKDGKGATFSFSLPITNE